MTSDLWTEWRITTLRRMWSEMSTAAAIAQAIGCTKDAVVGKAHRLGLDARESPIKRLAEGATHKRAPRRRMSKKLNDLTTARQRTAQIKETRRKLNAQPPAPLEPAPKPRRTGYELTGCRFPLGEPGQPGFRICEAKPVIEGRPYCAAHCKIAYTGFSRTLLTE